MVCNFQFKSAALSDTFAQNVVVVVYINTMKTTFDFNSRVFTSFQTS